MDFQFDKELTLQDAIDTLCRRGFPAVLTLISRLLVCTMK